LDGYLSNPILSDNIQIIQFILVDWEAVAIWRGIRERKEGSNGTEMVYLVVGDSPHLAHAGDEAVAPQRVSDPVAGFGDWGRLGH
jgi:hypothetical protein